MPLKRSGETRLAAMSAYPPSSAGASTTSQPPASQRAARRRSTGQSAPMTIAPRWRRSTRASARCMRWPRSAPRCFEVSKSSTGPQAAARATQSACRVRRACSRAARHSPRRGTSRVFTRPGTGVRANTSTAVSRLVESRKAFRSCPKVIEQAQPPHEHDRAKHAALLPAPARGPHPPAQAGRRAAALHFPAEGDVLHQRDRLEPGKCVATHENRLVAGGDAGEPRAQVHRPSDHLEEAMAPLDLDVEASPQTVFQCLVDKKIAVRGEERIHVQE